MGFFMIYYHVWNIADTRGVHFKGQKRDLGNSEREKKVKEYKRQNNTKWRGWERDWMKSRFKILAAPASFKQLREANKEIV